jgi:osmoprotectant transport system permease protein
MNFFEFLKDNWSELLTLTREHLFLVFVSTLVAVLIAMPLGILLTRLKSLQTPILGIANILQTVPSLALFGLLIPFPFIGGIGAKTAIIALTLYSFLPIIRNTVTGILSVDQRMECGANQSRRGNDRNGKICVEPAAVFDALARAGSGSFPRLRE